MFIVGSLAKALDGLSVFQASTVSILLLNSRTDERIGWDTSSIKVGQQRITDFQENLRGNRAGTPSTSDYKF